MCTFTKKGKNDDDKSQIVGPLGAGPKSLHIRVSNVKKFLLNTGSLSSEWRAENFYRKKTERRGIKKRTVRVVMV